MREERRQKMRRLPFHLDILVEMEDSNYVAHCLQLDIVAVGATTEEVIRDINDLIHAQIEFALEHDNLENLFKPAPPEVWEKLWRVKMLEAPSCERTNFSVHNRHNEADFCYAA